MLKPEIGLALPGFLDFLGWERELVWLVWANGETSQFQPTNLKESPNLPQRQSLMENQRGERKP
jgi:hypothetical protein